MLSVSVSRCRPLCVVPDLYAFSGANFRNVFYSALIEYGLHSDEVVTFSADFNGNQKRYVNADPWCAVLMHFLNRTRKVIRKDSRLADGEIRQINEKRVMQIIESPKFQTILIDLFHKHAKYYEALLVFVKDVDDFFSYYFVFKIAMYMMYIIVILYTIVFVSINFDINLQKNVILNMFANFLDKNFN